MMAFRTRCLHSLARTPVHRTQWRRIRISHRYYSSVKLDAAGDLHSAPQSTNVEDTEWFQNLRNEMLNRELPLQCDQIEDQPRKQLEKTLYSFFPEGWCGRSTDKPVPTLGRAMPDTLGEYLIFCNPALPDGELLPDGTDQLHSPGGSFVRRLWAGGAVKVNKDLYYDTKAGWALHKDILCFERIKDVQLRGQGQEEKIFVTIERKFARYYPVLNSIQAKGIRTRYNPDVSMETLLREKMRKWDSVLLTENRNIVFVRERSSKQIEDIKAGKMAPVRYLKPLGKPDFSHRLTPTRTLLSRFSALTFNAHLIHLDREYARNVEGHQNLLVHGPLTLTLMLKFIGTYLNSLLGGPHIVTAIEYRNIVPLYCGEELRLCAREKKESRTDDGRTYDVWIEGPTGGMAVKGLVRTAPRPNHAKSKNSYDRCPPTDGAGHSATLIRHISGKRNYKESVDVEGGAAPKETITLSPFSLPSSEQGVLDRIDIESSEDTPYTPRYAFFLPKQLSVLNSKHHSLRLVLRSHRQQYIRKHPSYDSQALRHCLQDIRDRYLSSTSRNSSEDPACSTHTTTTLNPNPTPTNSDPVSPIRKIHVPLLMRLKMDIRNQNILQRTMRMRSRRLRITRLRLVRYHDRNLAREVANSRFQRSGARRLYMNKPTIREFLTEWDHINEAKLRCGMFGRSGTPRKVVSDAGVNWGGRDPGGNRARALGWRRNEVCRLC